MAHGARSAPGAPPAPGRPGRAEKSRAGPPVGDRDAAHVALRGARLRPSHYSRWADDVGAGRARTAAAALRRRPEPFYRLPRLPLGCGQCTLPHTSPRARDVGDARPVARDRRSEGPHTSPRARDVGDALAGLARSRDAAPLPPRRTPSLPDPGAPLPAGGSPRPAQPGGARKNPRVVGPPPRVRGTPGAIWVGSHSGLEPRATDLYGRRWRPACPVA